MNDEFSCSDIKKFINDLDDIIIVSDRNGNIVYVNDTAIIRLGYSKIDIYEMGIVDLCYPHLSSEEKFFNDEVSNGNKSRKYLSLATRSGQLLSVEMCSWQGMWQCNQCLFHICKETSSEQELIKKFDMLFRRNPALMSISEMSDDRKGFVEVNESFINKTGYSREEIIGKTTRELGLVPDCERLELLYKKLLNDGQIDNEEITLRSKDGRILYGLISGSVILGHQKALLLLVVLDITQLKTIENELRLSKERYNQLAIQSKMFNWEVDDEGMFVFISDTCANVIGYKAEEVAGKMHFYDYHPAKGRWEFAESVKKMLAGATSFTELIHPLEAKDGTIIWLSVNGVRRSDENDGYYYRGACIDISESLRIHENLEYERQRLDDIITGTNTGTWEWNVQTGETIFNEQWASMLGYNLDELMPVSINTWMELTHPEDLAKTNELLQRNFAGEIDYFECEIRMRHKNNKWVWILTRGKVRNFDEEGKPLLMLGMHQDINARKLTEFELQATNNKLQNAIDKANVLVIQSNAANIAKSRFLANMSHEIRSPMNAILGYTQLMQRSGELTNEGNEYLQIINKSGEHLLALIDDIMDLSKIEAGKMSINLISFDLVGLIKDIYNTFKIRAESKGLEFYYDIDRTVPRYLFGDEGKIRQVLLNVLSNAVKFTSQGYITIYVSAQLKVPALDNSEYSLGEPQYSVHIEVEDSGCGINEAEQQIIFNMFEQAESGRKKGSGVGIGLALSRELARLMGGELSVDSRLGKGSTFVLEFVAAMADGEQVFNEVAAKPILSIAENQKQFKVLVVDDLETNRNLLNDMLFPVGFAVKEASSGFEAIKIFQNWQPDIILMDITMPGLDGYETTKQIRVLEHKRQAAIIMISAGVLDNSVERSLAAGADGFIPKPFKRDHLLTEIKRLSGVKYVYKEETKQADGKYEYDYDDKKHLSQCFTAEQLQAMQVAIKIGNKKKIMALISQLDNVNIALATRLRNLADNYEYDILNMLFANGGNDGGNA